MAVKSIGLSTVGGRRPCTLLDAARHNLREIQAEMGATGRIDPARSRANVILAGQDTAEGVQGAAGLLLAEVGPLRRDHCQALEFVFSLPAGCGIDVKGYFTKCLSWLEAELKLPVLSAVVHCDERAPHMHALLLPVGKDGRHMGSTPIGREPLRRLRASFFAAVAGRAGLRREGAKMRGKTKDWAVAAILRRCQDMGMPDACGPLWSVFKTAIERNPVAALDALEIDPDTIRGAAQELPGETRRTDAAQNPIGIEGSAQNPIGIEKRGQKTQSLSCVGIGTFGASKAAVQTTAQHPPEHQPIATLAELWERVGCRSVWRTIRAAPAAPAAPAVSERRPSKRKAASHADRIAAGRRAMQEAMARGHSDHAGEPAASVQEDGGGDAWVRIREDGAELPWPDNW